MHTANIGSSRNGLMWHVMVLGFLLVGVAAPSAARKGEDPSTYVPVTVFDPRRDAARDVAEAIAEAGRSGKYVLVDVGGNWCVWCHRLDSLFARHDSLSALLRRYYVVVKVNVSKENKNENVLARFPKIPGYPHLFVLDGTGNVMRSQNTGELESGKGHDPAKVSAFLRASAPVSAGRGER